VRFNGKHIQGDLCSRYDHCDKRNLDCIPWVNRNLLGEKTQNLCCLGRTLWLYFWCTSYIGCTKSTFSCNGILCLCFDMVERCARKSACVGERSHQHMGWNKASYAKEICSIIFSS
jgi:hypothetical protein